MIIIIHKVMMMIMEMVMIETVEMMVPAQMVERVAAHHAFLRQQSNALPDLRFLFNICQYLKTGFHHHLLLFLLVLKIMMMTISDEDYVDALVLSQQNAASSSLLDLAIVEVRLHLLLFLMMMTTKVR